MAPVQRQGRDKARPPPATKPRETSEVVSRGFDPARCCESRRLSPDKQPAAYLSCIFSFPYCAACVPTQERKKREDEEEEELERQCEKWCQRAITLSMVAGPVWSLLLFVFEWATRAPMLVDLSVRMDEQHAIITGGCSGMGEGLATMMVMAGATVVLGCRDSVKADAAVNRIKDATAGSPGSVETMELDLASFRSVRSFAEDYRATYKRLDVLVNNAGTLQACTTTEDGNEHAFQVNYLSHFLLTQLLLPTLKASAPSRVVHVTCEAAERSGQLPERGIWGRLYDAVLGSGEPVEPPLPIDVGDLDGQAVGARCSPCT